MTNTSLIILSSLVTAVLGSGLSPPSSCSYGNYSCIQEGQNQSSGPSPPSSCSYGNYSCIQEGQNQSSAPSPPSSCSYGNYSCIQDGQNLLEQYSDVPSAASCHQRCLSLPKCSYFSYYNSLVTPSLANTCFTFSSCGIQNTACHGCTSGRGNCTPCTGLPSSRGGEWQCIHQNSTSSHIPDLTKCFYRCGGRMIQTQCVSGQWTSIEGLPSVLSTLRCPCQLPPEGAECSPGIMENQTDVEGGTKCVRRCQDKLVAAATCEDGTWTGHLPDTCGGEEVVVSIGLVTTMAVLVSLVTIY